MKAKILAPERIKRYLDQLRAQGAKPATIKRRRAALEKFRQFARQELGWCGKSAGKPISPAIKPLSWREKLRLGYFSRARQLVGYFRLVGLVTLVVVLALLAYDQLIRRAERELAYPTSLTPPSRALSFQGRLTDSGDTPITTATNMVFRLYDAETNGTALWTSDTCSITPDQDGIFSVRLGATSGSDACGPAIPASVFSENVGVWLEVQVGTETLSPRQPIATAAYALNAETLQGYPASASATANTVPVINNSGDLVIAAASPTLQSTSGTFAIVGQALTVQTPDTSDGTITINPDGVGVLNLSFEGASPDTGYGGFVNATNANLTSGALYYGEVASNATGFNLLELKAGSTPSDKLVLQIASDGQGRLGINQANPGSNLDVVGDATISANLMTGGQFQVGRFGSAPTSIGVGSLYYNTGDNKLYLWNGSSWVDLTAGGGSTYWQLISDVLSPTSTNYSLAIGGTDSSAPFFVSNAGQISFSGDTTLYRSAANSLKTDDSLIIGDGSIANGQGFLTVNRAATISALIASDVLLQLNADSAQTANLLEINSTADAGGDLFVVDSSGQVGIGTTEISEKLDINGSLVIRSGNYLKTYDGTYKNNIMNFVAGQYGASVTFSPGQRLIIGSGESGTTASNNIVSNSEILYLTSDIATSVEAIRFITSLQNGWSNRVEAMTITGDGKVGLGTTSPTSKFYVTGAVTGKALAIFNETGDQNILVASSSGTTRLVVTNAGQVGIGTENPSEQLVVGDDLGSFGLATAVVLGDTDANSGFVVGQGGSNNLNVRWIYNATAANAYAHINTYGYNNDLYLDAADLALQSQSSGNVGIGVTTPGRKLEVSDAAAQLRLTNSSDSNYTEFFTDTSSNGYFYISNDVASADHMLRLSQSDSGSSIIYSTLVAARSDSDTGVQDILDLRHLSGNYATAGFGTGLIFRGGNTGTLGTSLAKIYAYTIDSSYSGAKLTFQTYNGTSLQDAVTIDESGKVGIGTTSPVQKLEIYDVGGSNTGLQITAANTAASFINFGDTDSGNPGVIAYYHSSNFMQFRTNGSEVMRIDSSGNIGIGTTSPTGKLHVAGAVTGKALAIFNETGDQNILVASSSGTTRLVITNSGRVGIGTISPQVQLHGVASNNEWKIERASSSNYAMLTFQTTGSSSWGIGTRTDTVTPADSFSIYSSTLGDNAITILNSGNVGIGTTSPGAKLNVYGTGVDFIIGNEGSGYSTLRILGSYTDDYAYIQAGTGSTDTTAKLRISRYKTANSTLADFQIYSDNTYFSGKVGVGTTSPTGKLHVTGAVTGKALAIFNETGDQNILVASSSGTTRLVVTNSGNVGIGTTSPSEKLEVNGRINVANNILIGGGTYLNRINAYGSQTNLVINSNGGALWLNHDVSDNVYLVTGGGNVGIGTTNPRWKTTIVNNIDIPTAGDSNWGLSISDTGDSNSSTALLLAVDSANSIGGIQVMDPLNSWTTENLVLQPKGGNVGIGTTSPGAKLDIQGNVWLKSDGNGTKVEAFRFGQNYNWDYPAVIVETYDNGGTNYSYFRGTRYGHNFYFQRGSADGTQSIARIGGNDSGQQIDLYDPTTTTVDVRLNTSGNSWLNGGNVGIGTTNPRWKTTIVNNIDIPTAGDSNWGLSISDTGDSNSSTALLLAVDSANSIGGIQVMDPLDSWTTENLVLQPQGGNVGIGTTSPGAKLNVNGNTRIGLPSYATTGNERSLTVYGYDTTNTAVINLVSTEGTSATSDDKVWHFTNRESDSNNLQFWYSPDGFATWTRIATWSTSGNLDIAGTLTEGSDIKLKKNIRPLENALDIIKELKGVRFTYRSNNEPSIGFIAQEVEKVVPELVKNMGENEIKGVKYSGFIPILSEAIKEQQEEIETLAQALAPVSLDQEGNLVITIQEPEQQLTIADHQGQPLATIDQEKTSLFGDLLVAGEATIAGKLSVGLGSDQSDRSEKSVQLEVKGSASVSGELAAKKVSAEEASFSAIYAEKIVTKKGHFGQLLAEKIKSVRAELEKLMTNKISTLSAELAETTPSGSSVAGLASDWSTEVSTQSGQLALSESPPLSEETIIAAQLTVQGKTTLEEALINQQLLVASISLQQNAISSLTNILYLQPSGVGKVDILAGTLVIEDNGSVTIKGNLAVKGTVTAKEYRGENGSFQINLGNLSDLGDLGKKSRFGRLLIKGTEGQSVVTIDAAGNITASGSATFAKVNIATGSAELIVASSSLGELATNSAQLKTNATAGEGVIPAGKTEVIIYSDQLTPASLVYITPTTDTDNQVLFVKEKAEDHFTVAIRQGLNREIRFNWWIIN